MDKDTEPDMWSDSRLIANISAFGYQMAEMGRVSQLAAEAALDGDYDGVRMYSQRGDTIREVAYQLKRDISAQIHLKSTNVLIGA